MMPDEKRIVLITGASSGFGELTASLLLSQQGHFGVFGTSRSGPAAVKKNESDGAEMVQLDITSDESVKSCVAAVLKEAGRIDVLVNNAGQAITGALEETSIEEAMAHLDSNFFGAVRMVNAVLPDMRRRKSGQIINIASMAGTFPVPFEGYYGISKAALITYSDVLRQEVKSLGIHVSVVEPGFFRTNLASSRAHASNEIADYDEQRTRVLRVLEPSFREGGDPRDVANTIVKIMETPSPRLHWAVGKERSALLAKRLLPASTVESHSRKHWRVDG